MDNEMNIGERIVTAVTGIVDIYFEVAETDTAPYAVYSLSPTPFYNKDGLYKYVADVTFVIVGSTYNEMSTLLSQCKAVLLALNGVDLLVRMAGEGYLPTGTEHITTLSLKITQIIS